MKEFIESVKTKNTDYQKLVAYIYQTKRIEVIKISAELDKFVNYWTERNKSGTKERWEMEKTFEVKRRLSTWFSRIQDQKINIMKI
jgi:hypothetical protein